MNSLKIFKLLAIALIIIFSGKIVTQEIEKLPSTPELSITIGNNTLRYVTLESNGKIINLSPDQVSQKISLTPNFLTKTPAYKYQSIVALTTTIKEEQEKYQLVIGITKNPKTNRILCILSFQKFDKRQGSYIPIKLKSISKNYPVRSIYTIEDTYHINLFLQGKNLEESLLQVIPFFSAHP